VSKTIPSQVLRNERLRKDPTCSRCGQTKTVSDFQTTGVDYWCRACRREYALAGYHRRRAAMSKDELQRLKDRINERQTQRREQRLSQMTPKQLAAYRKQVNAENAARRIRDRDIVLEAYGGKRCACCGETEPTFLSLDHVNNDGAKHKRDNKLRTSTQLYAMLIRQGYPKGFQVLCMNCQWGKRNNKGVCPHSGKV